MTSFLTRLAFSLLALGYVVSPAVAQDAKPALDSFQKCAGISADLDRLACYDKAASRFNFDQAEAALQEASRLKAEAKRLKAEKKAIAEAASRREAELDAKRTEEFGKRDAEVRTVDLIESEIARTRKPKVGGLYIQLSNGMVWQVVGGGKTGRIKPGMKVRVKKKAFGGFYLTIELSRRTLKVKRII